MRLVVTYNELDVHIKGSKTHHFYFTVSLLRWDKAVPNSYSFGSKDIRLHNPLSC